MVGSTLRRDVLLSSLVSSLPANFLGTAAASPLNPEPAIIAICGIGPMSYTLINPSQPGVRRV